ncbi:MAG: hypothetical protein AB1626_03605 [Candidatus Micrarchaeota archaeon]
MAVPAERLPELRRKLGGGLPPSTPSEYLRRVTAFHHRLPTATPQETVRGVGELRRHFEAVDWRGVEPETVRRKHDALLMDLHSSPFDNDFLRAAVANYGRSIASHEKVLVSPGVAHQLGIITRKPVTPYARVLRFARA